MKIWQLGWVVFAIAATSCSTAPPLSAEEVAEVAEVTEDVLPANTAPPSACVLESQAPLLPATDTELPFERFNFRPTAVTDTPTTLAFKGSHYSFTFCKRDRSWGVAALPPVTASENDYDAYLETLADPDYAPIGNDEQPYQARVRLDANWLGDQGNAAINAPEKVIFELIKPGNSQPSSTVLYTSDDIIRRDLGASAGVPTITQALATDESLWWAISFEQGEGASGIATVVQYRFDTKQILLWQPQTLANIQITDLALTGTDTDLTLWLGTQHSGEGNPYLPAKGLVAYRPLDEAIETYTIDNSPLPGAIPSRLWVEGKQLWAATAQGVCEIDWATIDDNDSWDCWHFTAMANLTDQQPLYQSLLATTPITQLDQPQAVEILWEADTAVDTAEAPTRYEIQYEPGISLTLKDQGASYYAAPDTAPGEGWFSWPGQDWIWQGSRFIRPWDRVALNYVGGGPQGIGPSDYENYIADWNTMRGEFELRDLTAETMEIRYYSAWVNDTDGEPWVTVTVAPPEPLTLGNPVEPVQQALQQETTPRQENNTNPGEEQ